MPSHPDPAAREVSVHPPHLLDSQGRPTPAGLIPFCAYCGDLATLGESFDGLDIPACNKFYPTILDGQLCYSLNVSSVISPEEKETKSGKRKGIFLAVDISEDGIFGEEEEKDWKKFLYTEDPIDQNSMSIHINTISRISDTRVGIYELAVLKKMTGTESFLALPDNLKGCQVESQEDCKRRRYSEEAQKQCGCVPWVLGSVLPEQVGIGQDTAYTYSTRLPATAARMAQNAGLELTRTPSAA
jgi:hypothetical protein